MGIWPLIHFSALLIYIYFFWIILLKNKDSLLNRICSILFFDMIIWTLGAIFFHNTQVSEKTAEMALNAASIGWTNFGITFVWFAVVFTRKTKPKNFLFWYLISLLPSFMFLYIQWSGKLVVDVVKYSYGWACVWTDSVWFYLYAGWYIILTVFSCYILYAYKNQTASIVEKKLASLMMICSMIALILGSLTDVIFLKMGIYFMPNTANLTGMVWAGGVAYAMVRYKFLELTPENAAEDIISTMADSLVLVGPDAKILDTNKYTLDLLGYKKDQLLGKPFALLFSEKTEEIPLRGEQLKNLLKKGIIRDYESEYITKEGEKIPVSFSAAVSRDQEKNLAGVVCIARDMREILRLINKEKDLAVELAAKEIEERKAIELKEAYDELKNAQDMLVNSEKLREMGELGAGVAHELNNPLSGVLSLMRTYKKKQGISPDEIEDFDEMEKGFEFMSGIVRSLSDFSRESSDEFSEINCNDIVKATINLVVTQLERKNIKIETEICQNISKIKGNRTQLQQILLNLITNSVEALFDGGIVSIKTRSLEVDGTVFVEIIVKDTGVGIKPEMLDDIFTPFFTTKRLGGGVGLGLSVVHSIVQAHKGRVLVESIEGKGSVFTIRIPAIVI